jgi:uncharacterized protein (DUF1697 family)
MTTYISLLRGINVSGQKIIKMDDLKRMFEKLNFRNVSVYLQSGNVIFQHEGIQEDSFKQIISKQIQADFGFNVPVIVLTIDKLKQIIGNNPFCNDPEKDESFFYVTFLDSLPGVYDFQSITDKKSEGEDISIMNNTVYLHCPNGYGKTKLNNNFLETKFKVNATTRNWRSVNEILKIAQKLGNWV